MAVKIRLRRMGQKKAPFYRIVVADARTPRDGKCIEEIGTYDPTRNPSAFSVNEELAKKWLNNGALPTQAVEKIFKLAGIEK
ncbi:SSU ribosomal protein S16P [Acetitomaculum ruminis DSM 5522]|uniref:Small ribosomal subunit protein bS16 n=1 Tax=Acetitomaculum ruminis DSM 5522 TaxID=1120918 RepID=A0A1I0VQH6_9FIRM|nr:30S ribosomal protein S16 [Acetitomaculum ruminis]SFA78150.1 SSU ribosomal protein S16P [Acetitomaculum ruminis DSM 5522]